MSATDPTGSPKGLDTFDPYSGPTEAQCVIDAFADHIHVGTPTTHSAITAPAFTFTVGDLKAAVAATAACSPQHAVKYAVKVYFGLDSQKNLDLILQPVCLVWDAATSSYKPVANNDHYAIGNGTLTLKAGGLANWLATNGDRYAKNVVVQRSTGSGWDAFIPGHDVVAMLYPYETELDLLIAHNSLQDSDTLTLVPGAEPTAWQHDGLGGATQYNHQQTAVWLPKTMADLDDTDHGPGAEFKNKAADLGAACPPQCPLVKFPASGLAKRPGCGA